MEGRWRRWHGFPLWLLLVLALGLVRWSKGTGFVDAYALLTRPFWPGPTQDQWIRSGVDLENASRLRLLEEDNKRLRELVALEDASGVQRLSAAVISRTVEGWWQQLELGCGALDGVRRGDAVLGPGGLLGRVQSVTPTTARVRLLTAPGSRIGVWLPRVQRHGMLIGAGTNRPRLEFINKNVSIQPGDLVSTSPASTLLPPNLPIGIVQSINMRAVPSPQAVVQLTTTAQAIDWAQIHRRH